MANVSFELMALFLTFLFANMAAFVIRADMASLLVVPNMVFLMQSGLVSTWVTLMTFLAMPVVLYLYSLEAFYVLTIHSVFYVAIVMKNLL
ncbi:hypothetical protein Btru_066372 [Bulinus truncatus]|nr:hypothetical protein Btru_066372 [Bulinus truncatus]